MRKQLLFLLLLAAFATAWNPNFNYRQTISWSSLGTSASFNGAVPLYVELNRDMCSGYAWTTTGDVAIPNQFYSNNSCALNQSFWIKPTITGSVISTYNYYSALSSSGLSNGSVADVFGSMPYFGVYHFDNETKNMGYDALNSKNLTCTNGILNTTNKQFGTGAFEGSKAGSCTYTGVILPNAAGTVGYELWIYPNSTVGTNEHILATFFGTRSGCPANKYALVTTFTENTGSIKTYQDNSGGGCTGQTSFTVGTVVNKSWNHLVCTQNYTGTTGVTCCLNGNCVTPNIAAGDIPANSSFRFNQDSQITNYTIDELRIINDSFSGINIADYAKSQYNSKGYTFGAIEKRPDFNFTFFDELTSAPILVNVTGINDTYSQLQGINVNNITKTWGTDSLPSGSNAYFLFQNSTYAARKYAATLIFNYTTVTERVFLLNASKGILMGFRAQDFSGNGITGVTIRITKNIGGSQQLITQEKTGGDGIIQIYLNPLDTYLLSASTVDGRTFTNSFQAYGYGGQVYAFILSATTTPPNFSASLNETFFNMQPSWNIIVANTNLTLTVNNTDGSLNWVSMYVYWNNSMNVYAANQSTTSSIQLSYQVNTTNMSGGFMTVYVGTMVKGYNYTGFVYNYTIFNPNNIIPYSGQASFNQVFVLMQSANPLTKMFITLLSTAIGTAAFASVLPIGAGFIALVIAGILTMGFQIISITQFAFIALLVFGIFIMRAR